MSDLAVSRRSNSTFPPRGQQNELGVLFGMASDPVHDGEQNARHLLRQDAVYYEMFEDAGAAIDWETRLKKYKREWKLNLIEKRKSRLARPDRWSLKICA